MRWIVKILCANILFIIFIAALAPSTALAEEWISGGVLGVDSRRGILTLALSGNNKTIRVAAISGRIPNKVHRGATVQAWGHYQDPSQTLFLAQRIVRIDSSPSPSDPTGVRKRLHKRFRP
jgi:hypothetical protein